MHPRFTLRWALLFIYPALPDPVGIAVGDFDADGHQDIVVGNVNSNVVQLDIYLGCP